MDLGLKEMVAKVHQGTREDALAFAVTANAKNGANLKPADRTAGIKRLLLLGWTQQAVSDAGGVSIQTISRSGNSLRLRGELPLEPPKRITRLTQLTQLGQLHTSGVLTDAEFESEKARVLASS